MVAAKQPAPMKDRPQCRRAILAAMRARDADKAVKLLPDLIDHPTLFGVGFEVKGFGLSSVPTSLR